jgi:hypothetical protein
MKRVGLYICPFAEMMFGMEEDKPEEITLAGSRDPGRENSRDTVA